MMVARNEFRAYRLVELILLFLLLLSPLEETHAIDSTPKLRGKDNEESIDSSVFHVTAESSSIGLTSDQSLSMTLTSDTSRPNGEGCSYTWECKSGRCTFYNVCEDKLPNGEICIFDEDCLSGYCSDTFGDSTCEPPSSSSTCFSSTSMVNHMSHGLVSISDINIGDYIQSNTDGSFSRVYAFKKNKTIKILSSTNFNPKLVLFLR